MAVVGGETCFFVDDDGFEVFETMETLIAEVWCLVFRTESYESYNAFEFEGRISAEIASPVVQRGKEMGKLGMSIGEMYNRAPL